MVILLQLQQTAGARSRAESNKQNNQQATRCQADYWRRQSGRWPKWPPMPLERLSLRPTYGGEVNLARSLKSFSIAGRHFDANFCLLPLYGDGNPLSRPQDVSNIKDAITVYDRHRLTGNNVTGEMKIQSSSTIAQLKQATSTFKEYLLKDRVHINNAQLGPEEAVVLG
jgi:hypothetical protein